MSAGMDLPTETPTTPRRTRLLLTASDLHQLVLPLYIACLIVCAMLLQLWAGIPAWLDGAPIEQFTAALLWMSSLLCLLLAREQAGLNLTTGVWLFGSAVLAAMAIDEIFAFHEQADVAFGDDDHYKVLQWVATAAGLWLVRRLEQPGKQVLLLFLLGFLLHTTYLITDVGDGDYFRIPVIDLHQLRFLEECLELLALSSYFASLYLLLVQKRPTGS